jgi:hypothetical protein
MMPQLSVFTLGALAVAYAAWRLNEDFVVGPLAHALTALSVSGQLAPGVLFETLPAGYSVELVVIAGFWAVFNMVRAGAFVAKALRNALQSHAFFRFCLPLPVTLDIEPAAAAQTVSLSEDWVRLALPSHAIGSGNIMPLTLHLPDGPLSCTVQVSRQEKGCLEGRFIWEEEAQQDRLAATLYSLGWQRELQHHHAYFLTPSDIIGRLFGQRPKGVEPKRHWEAGLLHRSNTLQDSVLLLATRSTESPQSVEIVSFVPLAFETAFPVVLPGTMASASSLSLVAELPIASLPHPGLNGKSYWRYSAIVDALPTLPNARI